MKSNMGKMSEDHPGGLTPGYHPGSMDPMDTTAPRKSGRRATAAIVDGMFDVDDEWLAMMDDVYDAGSTYVRHGVTVGRDVFGRFTRRTHEHAVTVWFHGADDIDHANVACANIVGSRRRPGGAIVGCSDARTGWSCDACVYVGVMPSRAYAATFDIAPTHGDPVPCDECGTVRALTAYPTMIVCGVRVRGVICRKCESAARASGIPIDNMARTHARIVYVVADHPVRRYASDATTTAAMVRTGWAA